MYAIILAGGVGSRLWPLSRNDSPKQLITLLSTRTMLQETVDRLLPLVPIENIVVVTGERYAEQAREQLPAMPPSNVIMEPAGRGTAPAIGLGLMYIERTARQRGENDPVVGSFHADHVITNKAEFRAVVRDAAYMAEQGYIVTLGIRPDSPHTGYGYIERGEQISGPQDRQVFRVERFVEKPPPSIAQQYFESPLYSWNSGMFIWKLSTILGEYKQHLPELYAQLNEIEAGMESDHARETLDHVWSGVHSETIDQGIAEKSHHMAVIPADFGWSDVGDWGAVADLMSIEQAGDEPGTGNAEVGPHITMDTTNSLVYSSVKGKLVATIGLDDMVIVDTPDVLLVCPRKRNQDVKKIVQKLKDEGLETYL